MKRYRLDPKNPRQLTPAEQRRLDAIPIDYSDIPPLDDEFFMADIDDETTEFGRISPEHEPTGEDELYAIIFDLVEQDCLAQNGDLDSWGIDAYERGIEALDGAGFVEIDRTCGRIYAKILPKWYKFKEWMEYHDRLNRILQARHELATSPTATLERLARYYSITVAEITGEKDRKR